MEKKSRAPERGERVNYLIIFIYVYLCIDWLAS